MAGARLREAMSDLAETIRRVFQPPVSHPVPLAWGVPFPGQAPPLAAAVGQPFVPCAATPRQGVLLRGGPVVTAALAFAAAVRGEPGWAAWETGAKVCALPMFRPERCGRLEVPALLRRAATRQVQPEAMTTRTRSGWAAFPLPGSRRVHEELAKVSKVLWMRYTLQLVRSTGENIRNLDVIGLYRIPAKGTRQLHHDPATGRLLVTLGPEASGAKRSLFILARRKTDASIVFCFVEEA
jgi:hypothetical protein